tara:strand:- start:6313 stop:6459 length:147 start_codon:yes stop_codon:yes gene_type:complete
VPVHGWLWVVAFSLVDSFSRLIFCHQYFLLNPVSAIFSRAEDKTLKKY